MPAIRLDWNTNIHDVQNYIYSELMNSGIEDYKENARVILEFVTGQSYFELCLNGIALSCSQVDKIDELVDARKKRVPLQYLAGQAFFMDLVLDVDENVLIPRPETELLVELVVETVGNDESLTVADVGTGSGGIAISLAKRLHENTRVIASDISSKALNVARKNALKNGVNNIEFIQGNLLDGISGSLDVVVANLPYVPSMDMSNLQEEVKKEPILALDGGFDGLRLIEPLVAQCAEKMKPGGCIFLEAGIGQTGKIADFLDANGFKNVNIYKDYSGIERLVTGA